MYVFKMGEAVSDDKPSSKVSVYADTNYFGYQYVIRPPVDFATEYEYYTTIGKVQSSIDAYVAEVRTRGYEFVPADEDEPSDSGIEAMEEWAKKYNLPSLLEYITRDLLVCGNNLLGITDWKPVQMDHIIGLKQDDYGNVTDYTISFNGRWESLPLKPDQYIHSKFIDINRMPWGIGLFHALTTTFSWSSHDAVPALELYRRHIQNIGVVEDKYAFPFIMFAFDGSTMSTAELEKLNAQLKAVKRGDKLMLTKTPTLITETIDAAKNGLLDITNNIQNDEITAGLQSSVNRLRTQPSAMADAKESNTKDDAMLLYIFDKLEEVINTKIIPLIPGADGVEFHFGQQDDMELSIQEMVQIANLTVGGKPVVAPEEVRMWIAQKGFTLDEDAYDELMEDQEAQKQQQMQQFNQQQQDPNNPNKQQQQGDNNNADNQDSEDDDDSVDELRKEAYRKIIKKLDSK